jgi:hypothetical protein
LVVRASRPDHQALAFFGVRRFPPLSFLRELPGKKEKTKAAATAALQKKPKPGHQPEALPARVNPGR